MIDKENILTNKLKDDIMPCKAIIESFEGKCNTSSSVLADVHLPLNDDNVGAVSGAVVVGCNSNNDNASARTVNGNNAVSNSNDNYAGRFSLRKEENENNGKTCTTCSARTNITEEVVNYDDYNDIVALLQGEYSEDDFIVDTSESHALLPIRDEFKSDPIWGELKKASSKRKLKNLKKFLTNRTIVTVAVERCLKKAAKSPQRAEAMLKKDEIIESIINELSNETYEIRNITKRVIKKRGKGDKNRNADIFSIYDRCVQNVLLIVLSVKLTNKLTRNVYSGVKGRSMLSNDRRYCLINRVHDYCCKHPDDYVMMTDIRHFYESLKSEYVLGVLFETVYDRYTRILLTKILLTTPSLPIGGTLSQLFAMLVLNECDRYILEHFKPSIYCIFGDNRFFGDKDKMKLLKIKEYQSIWYHARFNMEMKNDYSIHKIRNGFRLCKIDFNDKYVKLRSEMRRRSIRGAIRGQQHYAGYKGFLLKTDSKRLRYLIENHLSLLRRKIKVVSNFNNQHIIKINKIMGDMVNTDNIKKKLIGEKLNLIAMLNHKICIVDFVREKSKKEEGNDHFFSFQIAVPIMDEKGNSSIKMYRSWNGSADILYFFERVERGEIKLPIYTTVRKENNSFYFEGYNDYMSSVTNNIIQKFDIKFDEADFKEIGTIKKINNK